MNCTVSIIIPCYNHSASIGAAIASIQRQSYMNIEIVVIDDYSEVAVDFDMISAFTKHPIKLVRNTKNLGANMSINEGFNVASGDYICILAADDELPAESIIKRVELLDLGADIVLGATEQIFHNHSKAIKNISLEVDTILEWLGNKSVDTGINNATAMYTKELRQKTGYRLARGAKGSHEDYEYVLRLLLHASYPATVEHVCYTYFMDEGSTMFAEIKKDKQKWAMALRKLESEYIQKFRLKSNQP